MCRTGLFRFGIGNWIFLLACLHLFTCIQGGGESEAEAGVSFSVEPGDFAAEAGARVLLPCAARAAGRGHRLAWRHSQHAPTRDHTITHFNNRKQLPNGSLVIESLDATLAGQYQCVVTIEGVGTMVSRIATVFLAAVPPLAPGPGAVAAVRGQRALLPCWLAAPPRPALLVNHQPQQLSLGPMPPTVYLNVSWYKNGLPVSAEGARVAVLEGGALELDPAESRDAGEYACRVALASGRGDARSGPPIALQVAASLAEGPPRVVVAPRDAALLEGATAVLDCAAVGDPPPAITWLANGRAIDLNGSLGRVWWSGGHLVLRALRPADAAQYTCRAHNHHDASDAAATLTVMSAPRVAAAAGAVALRRRGAGSLTCEVAGRPAPALSWLKDGEQLSPNVRDISTPERGALRIQGVLAADAGVFQCVAASSAGSAAAATTLTVLPPADDDNVTKPKLDSKQFLTSLITDNDLTDPSPAEYPEELLGETSPAFSDYGDYGDHGANPGDYGVDERAENASVVSAPRGLRAVLLRHRFAALGWEPPARAAEDVQAYSVIYKVDGSERERQWWSAGPRLETNVASLLPDTAYLMCVRAHTASASSPCGEWLRVRTAAEDAAPAPPARVAAAPAGPRAVLLTWEPPDPPPPDPLYTIHYTDLESGREQSVSAMVRECAPRCSWTLGNLRAGGAYSVRVAGAGGPAAPPVQVTTPAAPPTLAPANVTARIDNQRLVVTWEWGGRARSLTGYKVRYRGGSARAGTVTTPADVRRAEVARLDPAADYQVRVCAVSGAGAGPYSEWVPARREPRRSDHSLPPPPPPLRTRAGRDWVSVWWDAGGAGAGAGAGLVLGWGLGVPDEHTRDLPPHTTRHTLSPLKPNSEYVISLRGSNALGLGPAVYATVRTRAGGAGEGDDDDGDDDPEDEGGEGDEGDHEPPLLPPVGVKVIMLSGTTAVVYWTDPTLPKGEEPGDGRRYVVRWAAGGRARSCNVSDRSAMVDDLRPYTTYDFSVKLIKDGRSSAWSMLVQNRSLEAAPGAPPRELAAAPAPPPARAVLLRWAPPARTNGPLTGYVVMYAVEAPSPEWATLAVVEATARLERLRANTRYLAKVQARNSKGLGPFCAPVSFLTGNVEVGSGAGVGGAAAVWLWASAGGACCVLALGAALALSLCCRRSSHHHTSTYQKSATSAAIKPPDLWIHHDQMELKHMDKHASTAMSASSVESRAEYEPPRPDLDHRHYVPTYVAGSDRRSCAASDDTALVRDSPLSCTLYSMGGGGVGGVGGAGGAGACGGGCDRRHRPCMPDQSTPLVSAVGPLGSPHSSLASLACGAAVCPLGAACTAPGAGLGAALGPGQGAALGPGAPLTAPGGDIYACAARERGHYVAYEPLGHYTHRDSSSSSPPPSSGVSNMSTLTAVGAAGTMDRGHGTMDRMHGTMDRQHGTMDRIHGTMDRQHGTMDRQHGTMERQHGTMDRQHGTMERQHGTMDRSHSTMDRALPPMPSMERNMSTMERNVSSMERSLAPLGAGAGAGAGGGSMERGGRGGRLHSFADNGSDRSTPPCKGSISDTSPYKKSSNSSPAHIPNRLHLGAHVASSAEELQPLTPSRSTERLQREMQNLEGLMKDLSAITHHHFHC